MNSIWKESASLPHFDTLEGSVTTDVLIIGGGIAGILCAYFLREKGVDYVLVEGNTICSGITENTTAKITSQHNLIYGYLREKFGAEKAGMYAHANQQAIENYARIIEKERVDCQFLRCPSFLYTREESRRGELEQEVETAKSLGIAASFVTDTELPFPVEGAVRFENQARFHPLEFIRKISEKVTVYEESRVVRLENNCVFTERGMVEGEHVVFAVHYPWQVVPGYYFLRMHQERSYVVEIGRAHV